MGKRGPAPGSWRRPTPPGEETPTLRCKVDRYPVTDEELWEFVATFLGVEIPRVVVCPGHVAPFTAFADAYFARHPMTIWKASRGLAGKSFLLATLCVMEMIAYGAAVTVLGGSGAQSQRVNEYAAALWRSPGAPKHLLADEPGRFETRLTTGAILSVLLASQRSARGPHPQRLRLDEVDEMDLGIFDAAMGQTLEGRTGVPAQTVASSTHQYPDGTMAEVLRRAAERGWPVYEWCYHESLQPHGWLAPAEVTRKRSEVTAAMWAVEYELQEPSTEGRAITPDAVEAMFDLTLGEYEGEEGAEIEVEAPVAYGVYTSGADWGKRHDRSAIATIRLDTDPARVVALWRDRRKPYAIMAPVLNRRAERFRGAVTHDSAGVGEAVGEHLTVRATGFESWAGKPRHILFNEYIAAVEQGRIVAPRVQAWYLAHKYVTNDDLFGSGHPPDEFVACALAWHGRPPYMRMAVDAVPVLQGGNRVAGTAMQSAPAQVEQSRGVGRRPGLII